MTVNGTKKAISFEMAFLQSFFECLAHNGQRPIEVLHSGWEIHA